jgi:hypothetical protein
MRRYLFSVLAAAIVLCAASQASAAIYPWEAIDWTGQYVTKIKFTNNEVVWSTADNQFKPANYTPAVGDVVYQILTATTIVWETGGGDIVKWTSSDAGELTAYAVAKITGFDSATNTYTFGPFGSGTDALNYSWGPNEVVALFFDTNKNYTANSGSRLTDRQRATDGTLFATFGFGPAIDAGQGGATGTPFLQSQVLSASPLSVFTSGGLNVKSLGAAFATIVFLPVDLPGYNFSATLQSNIQVASPANSNWPLKSEDPFRIRPTPEPGTLSALLGIVAAGGLGFLRRRRIGA